MKFTADLVLLSTRLHYRLLGKKPGFYRLGSDMVLIFFF
jgi:hypothetical protein